MIARMCNPVQMKHAGILMMGMIASLGYGAPPVPPTHAPPAVPSIIVTSPAADQFERAQLLFTQQQYSQALAEFSSLLQRHPGNARCEEALFRVAECYRLLHKADDALAAYQFFNKTYPESILLPQTNYQAGQLLFEKKNYRDAIPHLETACAKGYLATKTMASYTLAQAYLQTGRGDDGRKLLELLAKAQPPTTYSSLSAQILAENFEKSKQLPQALLWWQKTLALSESKPVQSQASSRGGWVAWQLNNVKEAEALFETCRRLDSGSDWRRLANTGLLELCFEQKRFTDVLELYNKERQMLLDSARSSILNAVGQSYWFLKRYPEAVDAFDLYLKDYRTEEPASEVAYLRLLAHAEIDREYVASDTLAYITQFPQSPRIPLVQFMRALDFSGRGKFAESVSMWEALAKANPAQLPMDQILLEWVRAQWELKKWPQAAETLGRFLERFPNHIEALHARYQRAMALQNAKDNTAVVAAWEEVRKAAPKKSQERQTALEQLALIYTQAKCTPEMMSAFEDLLADFPQSRLRALAAYSLGGIATERKDLRKAIAYLQKAREWDPAAWQLAATQRLVYLAYELKDAVQAGQFLREYEEVQAKNPGAPAMPASIYYWLGQTAKDKGQFVDAINDFAVVVMHPEPGEYRASAWWLMAECQTALKMWKFAVPSYEKYRQISPSTANNPEVILALALAQLGAVNLSAAQSLVEKVMLEQPEGVWNAKARLLLGEIYFARVDYPSAAKAFIALSLLYKDNDIAPRAMQRAADALEKTGDTVAADQWRKKSGRK